MKRSINQTKPKAAVFTPYLDVMGGGEKHILSILKILEDEKYEVGVIWDTDLRKEIKDKLHISFSSLQLFPHVLKHENNILNKLPFLKQFDIFIYVTNGGYFFSSAKKNFIFCMVPQQDLYKKTLLKRLKWHNYNFISNSFFTQKKLMDWGINSNVIYPYVDDDFIKMDNNEINKQKIILNVGRFFKHLHAKRQDIAIQTFLSFIKQYKEAEDYTLILAGGVKEEDKEYLAELQKMTNKHPQIVFKPNIPYLDLLELYKKASLYWHFAGYGIDDNEHPEQVEHLGITPLEAMAAGCITFCYKAGGPKETIESGKNGYLFSSQEELFEQASQIIKDTKLQQTIRAYAKKYVKQNFSYDVFRNRVKETILK